jgi:hypothetical protein
MPVGQRVMVTLRWNYPELGSRDATKPDVSQWQCSGVLVNNSGCWSFFKEFLIALHILIETP